jgi:hypothetical protein
VEGVDDRGRRVWDEDHVGLRDLLEAAYGGAVEAEAFGERVLVERVDRQAEVLPGAGEVGELKVDHPHTVGPREVKHVAGLHGAPGDVSPRRQRDAAVGVPREGDGGVPQVDDLRGEVEQRGHHQIASRPQRAEHEHDDASEASPPGQQSHGSPRASARVVPSPRSRVGQDGREVADVAGARHRVNVASLLPDRLFAGARNCGKPDRSAVAMTFQVSDTAIPADERLHYDCSRPERASRRRGFETLAPRAKEHGGAPGMTASVVRSESSRLRGDGCGSVDDPAVDEVRVPDAHGVRRACSSASVAPVESWTGWCGVGRSSRGRGWVSQAAAAGALRAAICRATRSPSRRAPRMSIELNESWNSRPAK